VISSTFFFELRATLAGDRSKLRSGTYRLQEGMSYSSVLKKLTTVPPAVPTTKLTLADGHSRAQVAALPATVNPISSLQPIANSRSAPTASSTSSTTCSTHSMNQV